MCDKEELLNRIKDVFIVELSALRNEIESLKKCQVDFIRLATILFGLTVTGVATVTANIDKIKLISDSNDMFGNLSVLIYILILSFTSLCYPYLMWVIIHKCRSIFRIIAYIRFIEDNIATHDDAYIKNYQGYERLHRKLKENFWLKKRLIDFNKYIPRILREFQTYKTRQEKANDSSFTKCPTFKFSSCDGLDKTKEPYIGNYYGKLLFYLQLIWQLNSAILVIISFYGFTTSHSVERYVYLASALFFSLWCIYHVVVTKRQLTETRYRPFSIDAHYDMWKLAFFELTN